MKGVDYIREENKTLLTKVLLFGASVFIICSVALDSQTESKIVEVENPTAIAGACNVPLEALNSPIETSISVESTDVEMVAEEEPQWVEMDVPSGNSFKSYMDCSYITDESSAQYQFKYDYLCSASGIMVVDGRYVVAIGSYYATEIGTRLDLVMENGSVVPCILGDCKADCHTDSTNRQHSVDGSVVEFIISTDNLDEKARQMGDCSYADERLMGEISAIRIYVEN